MNIRLSNHGCSIVKTIHHLFQWLQGICPRLHVYMQKKATIPLGSTYWVHKCLWSEAMTSLRVTECVRNKVQRCFQYRDSIPEDPATCSIHLKNKWTNEETAFILQCGHNGCTHSYIGLGGIGCTKGSWLDVNAGGLSMLVPLNLFDAPLHFTHACVFTTLTVICFVVTKQSCILSIDTHARCTTLWFEHVGRIPCILWMVMANPLSALNMFCFTLLQLATSSVS